MDTEDYPCQMPFSFTFKEGELAEYYKDWELVNIMKILAISIVEMRMAIGFNFDLQLCWQRKIKKKQEPSILLFAFYKQVEQGDLYVVHLVKRKPSP